MKKLLSILGFACICAVTVIAAGVTVAHARMERVAICHIPPGNPANAHTIYVPEPAVRGHLAHGDTRGECPVRCGGTTGHTCRADQFCKLSAGVCGTDAEGVCTNLPTTCSTTVSPVCGCDGTTYDNACFADSAGVSIDHTGECTGVGSACGGSSGVTCADGQFCKRADGACAADSEGVCTASPASCPAVNEPVCGCDNITYSNSCYADAAGVAVSATGACVPGAACGGVGGPTCGTDELCRPALGDCDVDAPGTCEPVPPVCSTDLAPVCGCDGITYDNSCLAETAGVGIDHNGACAADVVICGGAGGVTCGTGTFCLKSEGACDASAEGVCTPLPSDCPAEVDPACGCNGVTYSNDCIADALGVTVASDGPCEPVRVCDVVTGASCLTGQFCEAAVGDCAGATPGGCVDIPTSCSVIPGEVCGCDGLTYLNACFAEAAGVNVAATGACLRN
jgi:hypothetical protein